MPAMRAAPWLSASCKVGPWPALFRAAPSARPLGWHVYFALDVSAPRPHAPVKDHLGRYDKAESLLLRVVAAQERDAASESAKLAAALSDLGLVYLAQHKPGEPSLRFGGRSR